LIITRYYVTVNAIALAFAAVEIKMVEHSEGVPIWIVYVLIALCVITNLGCLIALIIIKRNRKKNGNIQILNILALVKVMHPNVAQENIGPNHGSRDVEDSNQVDDR